MHPSASPHTPPPEDTKPKLPDISPPTPKNWREAIFTLLNSRSAIFQIEAQQLSQTLIRRAIIAIIFLFSLFFCWCLLLVSAIAIIAQSFQLPWHWIALATAAIHLVICLALAAIFKKNVPPAFPVTRSEFKKDQEWILKL